MRAAVVVSLILLVQCYDAFQIVKPKRLQHGDNVILISPASPYSYSVSDVNQYLIRVEGVMKNLLKLSKVVQGPHMNETYGYLAGPDADRAADVNLAFSDSSIQFIVSNRGGFGCIRTMQLVDYNAVLKNPKVLMGYSDLTALIHAVHFMTGLVTFHGPMGIDNWYNANGEYVQRVLFNAEQVLFKNPPDSNITSKTYHGGKARGRLYGGNLSTFLSMLQSKYFPRDFKWSEVILFLEDVDEVPYHIDRMLIELEFQGVFASVAGVVWGTCTSCSADPSQSLTLDQVLEMHFKQLTVPVFSGFMFGHIAQQFTLPIGIQVELDADAHTLQMLEPAVL